MSIYHAVLILDWLLMAAIVGIVSLTLLLDRA